jgi:nucleobase:cation symporter-1, NCS1 family
MVFDFYLIHDMKYSVLALYQPDGIYRYNSLGINPRAVIAFLIGVAPNLPGFINSINPKISVGVGVHPYEFGWLLGFTATSIVYVALSYAFPPAETMLERPVYPDEIYEAEEVEGVPVAGVEADEGDVEQGEGEKKGFRSWADRMI